MSDPSQQVRRQSPRRRRSQHVTMHTNLRIWFLKKQFVNKQISREEEEEKQLEEKQREERYKRSASMLQRTNSFCLKTYKLQLEKITESTLQQQKRKMEKSFAFPAKRIKFD